MEGRINIVTLPNNIFFDWDGTLTDSLPILFESHNHVRKELGFPLWSMEEYKGQMYRSSLDLYPELYGEKSEAALEYLYGYFEDNHLRNLTEIEGAIDFLESLHEQGITMGLVSNKKHKYLEREVEHLGWRRFFKAVIGAGHAEEDKPHPAPLLEALDRAGIKPCKEAVWYVGDTRTDIETANNAGCASVLVTHGEDKEDLIAQYKPDYVFDSFSHLLSAAMQDNKKKA